MTDEHCVVSTDCPGRKLYTCFRIWERVLDLPIVQDDFTESFEESHRGLA
jgi:hypothetical protein